MRKKRTIVLSRHFSLILFSILLLIMIFSIIFFVQARITGNATNTCGNGLCTSGESCEWNGALNRQMLCDGKQSVIPKGGICRSCIYTSPTQPTLQTSSTSTCNNLHCDTGETCEWDGTKNVRCDGKQTLLTSTQKCTQCVLKNACGDGICDTGETCEVGACPSGQHCSELPTFLCDGTQTPQPSGTICTWCQSHGCGDHICESSETPTTCPTDCIVATCTDTDGGVQKNIKGTVSGINNAGQPYSNTDTCSGINAVLEHSCAGTSPTSQTLSCDSGYTCNDGACQLVQPYCGDTICNNGETCSTCATDCGTCQLPPSCNAINWDGKPLANHVNFVFVPSNFNGDMASFEANARRIWSTFNAYTPYTNNPSLNALFVTNEAGNYCWQPCNGIDRLLCCDTAKAKTISSACTSSARQTIVVHNGQDYGGAGYPSEDVATTTLHASAPQVAVHETGHSFGNLYDEYGVGTSVNPNCDTASCSKWDEMFSKGWGVSCIGGTHSCPDGYCQYCSGGNYYIGEQSIMYATNLQFEEVNERAMCCAYRQESGSYPAYCDKYKSLTPTLDQYCGVSAIKGPISNGQVYLQNPIEYTFVKKPTGWILESATPRFAGNYPKEKTQGDKNGKNKLKLVLTNGKTKIFTFSDTTQIEIPGNNQKLQGYTTQPRKSIAIILDNTPKSSLKTIELNGAQLANK